MFINVGEKAQTQIKPTNCAGCDKALHGAGKMFG